MKYEGPPRQDLVGTLLFYFIFESLIVFNEIRNNVKRNEQIYTNQCV